MHRESAAVETGLAPSPETRQAASLQKMRRHLFRAGSGEIGPNRNKLKKTGCGYILHENLRKLSWHGQSVYHHRSSGFVSQKA